MINLHVNYKKIVFNLLSKFTLKIHPSKLLEKISEKHFCLNKLNPFSLLYISYTPIYF